MFEREHTRCKPLGQGTVELVLLLPILMFLFSLIAYTFREHHEAKNEVVSRHYETLEKFDHGNGGPVVIGGETVVPERGRLTIGEAGGSIFSALAGGLMDVGASVAAQSFLDKLFDSIDFFNQSTYLSEYTRAYTKSSLNGLVTTGEVDWQAAQTAGYTAAFSSDQATRHFQGMNFESASTREFFGSTLQDAVVAYANSDGDWSSAAGGAVGGALYSDTSNSWFENGSAEILKGATRGAINGSLSGLASGEKVGLAAVGKMAATGGFQTKAVARMLPMGDWEAQGNDPRSSAAFGAANAGFSTLLNQGSKTALDDFVYSSLDGAFFSGQSSQTIQGEGGGFSKMLRSSVASSSYQAGTMSLQGEKSESVREVFYGNLAGAGAAYAGGLIMTPINRGIQRVTQGAVDAVGINKLLGEKKSVDEAAVSMTETMPTESMGNLFGVYAPYQEVQSQ